MKGPEFKEAAQIQGGIRVALKDAQGFDIDSIKALGERPFVEKSVFGKRIEGTVHFDEIAECRIEGKQIYIEKSSFIFRASTKSGRSYYCLISTKKDGAGYDISIVPEMIITDALKGGIVKFTHESTDKESKHILGLYTEHEISTEGNIAIDPWIEDKMLRGEYAVDDETAKTPLYRHPGRKNYSRSEYAALVTNISKRLEVVGVKTDNVNVITDTMLSTPLVFLSYKSENELPLITIRDKKVRVKAHSSQFATYIFLPEKLYAKIVKDGERDEVLTTLVEDRFTHEIGARCGLKVTVQNGHALNLLDSAVANYRSTPAHGKSPAVPSEIRELKPVNLLELELRNDYAAGHEVKKSIFKRVAAVLVAAVVTAQGSVFGVTPQIPVNQLTAPSVVATSINEPKRIVNTATQPYQFAYKYTIEDVVRNQEKAEAFIQEYFKWESGFYKSIRINGIAIDGFNLREDMLTPAQARDWTAASKECLDLAVQLKILTGNKYGIRLTGYNDAGVARQTAVNILKEKMDAYEEYNHSFPAFGGFLPWITIRGGKIQPASDWSDKLPALDNGEWVWSLYTAYHTLKNAGENDLAARYKKYFEMLAKNAPSIFYDTVLRKIRAEVKIRNPKAEYVNARNYSNNTAGYYLDDCYEGVMMACFLTLFTDLPKSEKDRIWDDIKMEKITTKYGTTYKGWPPQSPLDGSPHIKWAFMFLPFTDNPIAMRVYLLQEKIRTNMHKYGIPVSANTPGAIGYGAYEPNVFGLYGSFSMIFGQTLQGNVTQNNYGLAWFLNMLQADKMQGPLGSGESIRVKPGTNQLEGISTVVTVDGKMTLWLAMMGGIQKETGEALKTDGLYDRFMAPINRLYAATFGDISSVQDNARFCLPQGPIAGRYTPEVSEQMTGTIDLSTFWQYPALDRWGDKTSVRIDGNKMIIEHKPGAEGGYGWAGGSLRSPLTPSKGSAIYLKGKGRFTLKLECKDREAVYIDVNLTEEDKWTKVPLDTAVGKTFSVIVIDRITETIVIADRFYSADGKAPDKNVQLESVPITIPTKEAGEKEIRRIEGAEKLPAGEAERRAKAERDAINKAQMDMIGTAVGISGIESMAECVDRITEILWEAGLGSITEIKAKEMLAELVPEVRLTQSERNTAFDIWLAQASLAMAAMAVKSAKHGKPSDEDIRLIAMSIKEFGVEVLVPKSQFRGDSISKYRGIIEAIGGKLRVYQHIEDLQNMITKPEKSIIMTVDVANEDINFLRGLKLKMNGLRVMNFAKMEGFDKMDLDELDNYEAEILGILLVARIITQEDFQDKGSPAYRMLSHLLEDYMPDNVSVENYIQDIVMNSARLIKTILKALPITAYKVMRQSVEVLWAA